MRLANTYRTDRPAHDTVTADSAANLYARDGVDWPVSADESVRALGYIAIRHARVNLWTRPNVRPAIATTGIRIGDTITAHGRTGVVTRVGTIAGWMSVAGQEVRWEHYGVTSITPAPYVHTGFECGAL